GPGLFVKSAEQPEKQSVDKLGLDGRCDFASRPCDVDRRPLLGGDVAQLAGGPVDQRAKIDPPAPIASSRMDLRREIEVVDGGEQQPRLTDDFGSPVAIAAVGRPEILSLYDLGKTDDRVQRGLDLVDQLAQRIG